MKKTDFAKYITDFFGQYLPIECGLSANTIKSYSYTFTLFLKFMSSEILLKPECIHLKDIEQKHIIAFLKWIEKERKCSANTKNARLAAIHSFFKYLQYKNILNIHKCQEILSIPLTKTVEKEMSYLSVDGITMLLKQPNLNTAYGRRDLALLGLLYDSGARVQELIDLTPSDIRFGETTTIRLFGKSKRVRIVPLAKNQVNNLRRYMVENDLLKNEKSSHPLFPNKQGCILSRMAVLNIVKKYCKIARCSSPNLIPEDISCHSFRHSKAVHMLDAGINLVYIRDFLGHTSVTTTELYAKVSDGVKFKALSKLNPDIVKEQKASWNKDASLMLYLQSMQK